MSSKQGRQAAEVTAWGGGGVHKQLGRGDCSIVAVSKLPPPPPPSHLKGATWPVNPERTPSLLLVPCLTPEPLHLHPNPSTGLLPLFLSTPQLCRFPPIWLENKQRPTPASYWRGRRCAVCVWLPLCMRMCAHTHVCMLCMCAPVCVRVCVCPCARLCIVLCACICAGSLVVCVTVHVCTRARVCVRACVSGVQAREGPPGSGGDLKPLSRLPA